jgi:hypothetical protein
LRGKTDDDAQTSRALLGTLIAGGAFVSGLHTAMAVSAGSFLIAALVTAATVARRR